ncbi:S-adenosyl-L-methionine-dependent methyltransferase [Xylona heveae TC161]|uniref:S-adenosyl-L-methionine-dependent methyltransferase n=1 Tax=Xylona heveae (strain CBS 132557 / TC161) TaxID=1328760 RepID=A0A164Z8Z6_XYLHT|nr:S-adenosyl-L-methionine-dependent methyltransferase [Xylona heveae TC161]KZF18828.1 S-adenosyl-L-methionine-dependent methyltransferase [Xylona heveae TC161]
MATVVPETPSFGEWFLGLFSHGTLIVSSVYFHIQVWIEILLGRVPRSDLREEAFSRFWTFFTTRPAPDPTSPPPPPTGSATLAPSLFAQASGVVLDLGPGNGAQMPLLAKAAPAIREVYAAEPCVRLHTQLAAKAREHGLGEKYNILPCSASPESLIQTLAKEGLLTGNADQGIFDTIICCRVLCSVPDLEETVRGLYRLLRPGGKLLVCEHVQSPWSKAKGGSFLSRTMQHVYMFLGWKYLIGDCELLRETDKVLLEIAEEEEEEEEDVTGWKTPDLKLHFAWSTLPYVSGVLVKKD